jgi:uncharacterized protein YegL
MPASLRETQQGESIKDALMITDDEPNDTWQLGRGHVMQERLSSKHL